VFRKNELQPVLQLGDGNGPKVTWTINAETVQVGFHFSGLARIIGKVKSTSPVSAFTYGNFTFGDPSKSDAIDARRISCE